MQAQDPRGGRGARATTTTTTTTTIANQHRANMTFTRTMHPLLATILLSLTLALVSGTTHGLSLATGRPSNRFEGWTEVSRDWPLQEESYFIATEKGHHFIEVKVPPGLADDLIVSLRYYYKYARVRPVLQMTPCNANQYLVNETSADTSGRWVWHQERARRANCARRPELAYNVLLHDPGDVFAWSIMKITSEPEEVDGPGGEQPTTTTTMVAPNGVDDVAGDGDEQTDTFTQKPGPVYEQLEDRLPVPTAAPAATTTTTTTTKSPPYQEATEVTTVAAPQEQSETTMRPYIDLEQPVFGSQESSPNFNIAETPTKLPEVESPPASTSNDIQETEDREAPEPSGPPAPSDENGTSSSSPSSPRANDSPQTDVASTSAGSKSPEREKPSKISDKNNKDNKKPRRKRDLAAAATGGQPDHWDVECHPKSCNRNTFKMARFTTMTRKFPGFPGNLSAASLGQRGADGFKFWFNTKNRPLRATLVSRQDSFEEVDTCLRLWLLMDKNTELEFLVQDPRDPARDQLLELITRRPGDSTAGEWDNFYRCIGDYMHHYQTQGPNATAATAASTTTTTSDVNSLRFTLRQRGPSGSHGYQPDRRVAVLVENGRAVELRQLYPIREYIPDLREYAAAADIRHYWLLDKDGLMKPQVAFKPAAAAAAAAESQQAAAGAEAGERSLVISDIDPVQESFDLTSRWMRIRDAEIIDDPILFVYRFERAAWVRQVDLQFQRAGDPQDQWVSQKVYPAAAAATNGTGPTSGGADPVVSLPIRMRGLDSGEFRVRVRHLLRPYRPQGALDLRPTYSLAVRSLAFGDACSMPSSCQNGATCRPTGPATYECVCPRGYSGLHCQLIKPCEVLYGSPNAAGAPMVSGYEICRSIGARCVEELPVMRCQWDNDQYYHCRSLYQISSPAGGGAGGTSTSTTGGNSNGSVILVPRAPIGDEIRHNASAIESLAPQEQIAVLKGIVNQNAKLVIILVVFIVAILIFSVVLVGSMVARLRKSKRKLEQSQSNNHELTRRSHASTGSSTLFGGGGVGGGGPSGQHQQQQRISSTGRSGGKAAVTSYSNSPFDVD